MSSMTKTLHPGLKFCFFVTLNWIWFKSCISVFCEWIFMSQAQGAPTGALSCATMAATLTTDDARAARAVRSLKAASVKDVWRADEALTAGNVSWRSATMVVCTTTQTARVPAPSGVTARTVVVSSFLPILSWSRNSYPRGSYAP